MASVATSERPAIIFIDDIDTIIGSRDNSDSSHKIYELGTFLKRIEYAHNDNTLVIAATNKFDKLDTAIKRRFDRQIYVSLPDKEARISLLKFFLNANKSKALANNDKVIEQFAESLSSFPISAIKNIVSAACDIPRKEAKEARAQGIIMRRDVNAKDFETIINKPETNNLRINEKNYMTKATTGIGFSVPLIK